MVAGVLSVQAHAVLLSLVVGEGLFPLSAISFSCHFVARRRVRAVPRRRDLEFTTLGDAVTERGAAAVQEGVF